MERFVVTTRWHAVRSGLIYGMLRCNFSFPLRDGKGFVALGSGLVNGRSYGVRVKSFQPLAGGDVFPSLDKKDAKNLNGGAGSTRNLVREGADLTCGNSLLYTFTANGVRRSLVMGGLTYHDFAKHAALGPYELWDTYPRYWNSPQIGMTWQTVWVPLNAKSLPDIFPVVNAQVAALDPVGRLVDPGTTYEPDDLFYVDVTTADPFAALENYGKALRTATHSRPNIYNNFTICGWFSGLRNAQSLVEEMDRANQADMLKTIPVTVRLEPNTYCWADNGNTEQGWGDDAHWLKYHHLASPYDTFKKWVAAVKERGGMAETYFQCGMPSDDYALAFPGHMVNNDISNLHRRHTHVTPSVTYDATDPGFQEHMRKVWAYLKECGLAGVKFDYPDIAWRSDGGFEDKHATAAAAYRAWFQLCRDGLGPDALIHERALGNTCLDVTAGIVDLQRVWGDADRWYPGMAAICGLRWYKNRVVMSYYPDSKAFVGFNEKGRIDHAPMEMVKRRSILTMLYATAGRIESASSVSKLDRATIYDIGRCFPMHVTPQSARPVDAFTGVKTPRVYDFRVDDAWHQVALCNDEPAPVTVSAPLSGDQAATGSLGLDAAKTYYIYEFWADKFLGKHPGTGKLEVPIAAGEARMYSVREALDHPQVLSTNRHLMQGYVDLIDVKWVAKAKQLSGVAKVVGNEAFRIVVANNGGTPGAVNAMGAKAHMEPYPGDASLSVLVLERTENGDASWSVNY